MNKQLSPMEAALRQIANLSDHNIPHYAYGDNEAGCSMASILNEIGRVASSALSELLTSSSNDLERLYEWLMDENRKKAQTFFTAGELRNVAKEIEFRLFAASKVVEVKSKSLTAPDRSFLDVLIENRDAMVTGKNQGMSTDEIFETGNMYDAVINGLNDLIEIYKSKYL